MTGQQTLDSTIQCLFTGRCVIGKIVRQRREVDLRLYRARFEKRLDLRSKVERTVVGVNVVERLYSQSIASDEEFSLLRDPKSQTQTCRAGNRHNASPCSS